MAEHLRTLGLEVREGVGGTGVVGILKGVKIGRTIALRADTGKTWGAKRMLDEGAFKDPKPDVVFGLHFMPGPWGQISFRAGATTASTDDLAIVVTGKQGLGGMPKFQPLLQFRTSRAHLARIRNKHIDILRTVIRGDLPSPSRTLLLREGYGPADRAYRRC